MDIKNPVILITVDVEDWFHVENLRSRISFSSWSECERRVERNVLRLLDLFDSCGAKLAHDGAIQSTFFVLGWVAEQMPGLVQEIQARGHEVASHGYSHSLCGECTEEQLKGDMRGAKKLLEDITGERVFGYRAPNFSIDDRSLQIVKECGFVYDSSYNSFFLHGRYGRLSLSSNASHSIAVDATAFQTSEPAGSFFEVPVSNLEFKIQNSKSKEKKFIFPWGGGAYFRLMPFVVFKQGVKRILRKRGIYVFYLHPWEIDPGQPRVNGLPLGKRIRHYSGLSKTYLLLKKFIESFRHCQFTSCYAHVLKYAEAGRVLPKYRIKPKD